MKSQKTLQFKWPKFFNSKIQGKKKLEEGNRDFKRWKSLINFFKEQD